MIKECQNKQKTCHRDCKEQCKHKYDVLHDQQDRIYELFHQFCEDVNLDWEYRKVLLNFCCFLSDKGV